MFTKDDGRRIYSGVAITYTSAAASTDLTPGNYILRNIGNDSVHFNTEQTATTNDCIIPSSSSLPAIFEYPVAITENLYYIGNSTGGTIMATKIG
jgi:hypothetical protein